MGPEYDNYKEPDRPAAMSAVRRYLVVGTAFLVAVGFVFAVALVLSRNPWRLAPARPAGHTAEGQPEGRSMRGGVDRGMCLNYWRLSYRRKFIRFAWTGAVAMTALVVLQLTGDLDDYFSAVNRRPMHGAGWRTIGLVATFFAVGSIYTFVRWRRKR
jgi:hypothetical protein